MPTDAAPTPAVNGFLNFYKPAGISSMDALRRVKRITRQRKKVGHAGTLDPLAEGVLPVCFGQATRLMEQIVAGRKRYRMTVRLGAVSNTYDAEGDIVEIASPAGLRRADLAAALLKFVGKINQTPPMYSAVKIDGRRLYELARAGREIPRSPRPVTVYAIAIDRIALPDLHLTVDCGRGTYLRSIAHDLGQELGCGGYVTQLARLSCGGFQAADGVSLETLADAVAAGDDWRRHLRPVDWALRHLPAVSVNAGAARAIRNGQPVPAAGRLLPPSGNAGIPASGDDDCRRRAYDPDGVFLALLEYRGQPDEPYWHPARVFRGLEPSPYAPAAAGAPAD